VDDETPLTLALLQPKRRREWELQHGDEKVAELRLPAMRSGGRAGYGLVGPEGEPWLRAKVKSGAFRTTGQIEVASGRDPALPSVIAAYLLIRKVEEAAASSAATVAAT